MCLVLLTVSVNGISILKRPNNSRKIPSDYRNAIKTVQSGNALFHEKALNALEAVAFVRRIFENLLIHSTKEIAECSRRIVPVSLDKVVKLTVVITPDGWTALYDNWWIVGWFMTITWKKTLQEEKGMMIQSDYRSCYRWWWSVLNADQESNKISRD